MSQKKSKNLFYRSILAVILIIGWIFIIYSYLFTSISLYNFNKFGIEKQAKVLYIVPMNNANYSISYKTSIDIDGKTFTIELSNRHPLLGYITVLVMPDDFNKITIGSKKSSIFDLFAYQCGNYFVAVVSIFASLFMLIFSPFFLLDLINNNLRNP